MSTAPKLAQRTQFTGTFSGDQTQRLAQDAARKVNSHADMLAALQNRSYAALTVDTTIGVAAYATLLTANITTVLATGYLIITWSASTTHPTNGGTTSFQVLVDGVVQKGCYSSFQAGFGANMGMTVRVAVTRGAHAVLLQWKTDILSARVRAATVVEEHAHLLVQEAS